VKKLHELLAVEKTVANASNKLYSETLDKFGKENYWRGHTKTLRMIADSPENAALESASVDERQLTTNVVATLTYFFEYWARTEDVLHSKNCSNQHAVANLEYRGEILATAVPIDELLGLEVRLENLRKLLVAMPTLDAGKNWKQSEQHEPGVWTTVAPEVTTKTEKRLSAVVLVEPTKEHPAQVREVSKEEVVGTFTSTQFSGAATSRAKAAALSTVDDLILATKRARTIANSVDVVNVSIGKTLAAKILAAFN